MRRLYLSLMMALFAVALVFTPASAGTLSKKKSKKVSSYFTSSLQNGSVVYSGNEKISMSDIKTVRKAVWECWCEAVNNFGEDKLIAPYSTTEPRDTGFWALPEELEPKAVMPYYFIKKGALQNFFCKATNSFSNIIANNNPWNVLVIQ